jgi:hypothetical protein
VKELLRALDRELLGDVDVLAAAVVALAGIALSVLVGEHRALRGEDRGARVVLRRDQLDVVFLSVQLVAQRLPQLGIDFCEGFVGEHVDGGSRIPGVRLVYHAAAQ